MATIKRTYFSTEANAWKFALAVSGRLVITNYGKDSTRNDKPFFVETISAEA